MSGYEETFLARAEMLEDVDELVQAITAVLAGAQGAGVDPAAVTSLAASARALDPGASASYDAGTKEDRHPGTGYRSDGAFLEAVSEAEDGVQERLREVQRLDEQIMAAVDRARDDLVRAQRDVKAARAALAAAHAMPTRDRCTGCHPAKAAAIAAAEAADANAEGRVIGAARRIGLCDAAAENLDPLTRRLQATLQSLRQVPHDLGEIYELIYEFIRRGGRLPAYGRWIEGEGIPPVTGPATLSWTGPQPRACRSP